MCERGTQRGISQPHLQFYKTVRKAGERPNGKNQCFEKVMPFWRAVFGYEPRRDSPNEDLVDPHDRGAPFWFEQMNEPRGEGSAVQVELTEPERFGGGAIHVAIWVPYEQAEARVAAALAAGSRLVRDEFVPAWWTLANAAGNEADIAP